MTPAARIYSFTRPAFLALLVAVLATPPAHAVSKEMIQLQTQMQQIQEALARLQQTNDENMGVLKNLVQQQSDVVNQMSVKVNGLTLHLQNLQDANGAKNDQLSGQVQSLNDSIDEVKARIARMEKTLTDIQGQQSSTSALLSSMPAGGGASSPAAPVSGKPSSPQQGPPLGGTPSPAAGNAPPVTEMYRTAYSDFMAAKYSLAGSEFSDLISAYPDENLAGNSYFYLGEIGLRAKNYPLAVKNYDLLLERYSNNAKAPAAHLHKAQALADGHDNDAASRELRTLIQRYPTSPEAAQAKSRLAALRAPR